MARGHDRFLAAAAAMGLHPEIRWFPAETRTAETAAEAIGCDVAQIVKSLVFMADGRPFLALTSGANRADPHRLASILRVQDVRRATPEEARQATGFAIGGTAPFGHTASLPVLIDRDLTAHEQVWAAAGTPDSVFPITPIGLLKATDGQVVDFRETKGG
jgi:prolyl-tRNA editing enzyme YbaK/EbsC (Cys-tRNA(Pro) deacylase)